MFGGIDFLFGVFAIYGWFVWIWVDILLPCCLIVAVDLFVMLVVFSLVCLVIVCALFVLCVCCLVAIACFVFDYVGVVVVV